MNKKILVCNKIKVFVSFFIAIVFFLNLMSFSKAKSINYDLPNYNISEEKKVIPIAMATDNNYVYPTIISMVSMCENKKSDTYLKFNIMLSGDVNEKNRKKIKDIQGMYRGCSVEIFDMKSKFSDAHITGHFTTPMYYRLCLSSLLPNCDKVIYIDSDTIVKNDL